MKSCIMLEGKLCEKEECISRKACVFSPSLCYWEPSSWWLRVGASTVNGLTRRSTALSVRVKSSNFPRFIPALILLQTLWSQAHLDDGWYLLWNKQHVCVCVCGTRTPTWAPLMSMWQGVTLHSRLGFLTSLPHCAPLPSPGWQMVKDNVSTWESNTLKDWECVIGSATGYRDLLKNRNIICCWVMGSLNSVRIRNRDISAEHRTCNFF